MINWFVRATCRRPAVSPVSVPPDVAVRIASWIPAVAGVFMGFGRAVSAVTLESTIVIHPSVTITPELMRHELAHVRQWQAHRLTFMSRYLMNHFRYGYEANPYEVEARAAENIEAPFERKHYG
jgi:hypothetical protein